MGKMGRNPNIKAEVIVAGRFLSEKVLNSSSRLFDIGVVADSVVAAFVRLAVAIVMTMGNPVNEHKASYVMAVGRHPYCTYIIPHRDKFVNPLI